MNNGMYKAIDIIDDTHSQYVEDGELVQDIKENTDTAQIFDLIEEMFNLLTPKKKLILDMTLDTIKVYIEEHVNDIAESVIYECIDQIRTKIDKEIGEVSDIWLLDPSRESLLKKYDRDSKKTSDDFQKHEKKLRNNGELL